MAGFFLTLDIDRNGVTAVIFRETLQGIAVRERRRIDYADLPAAEANIGAHDLFRRAMAVIAGDMAMAECATAVLAIPCANASFRNISFPFSSSKKIRQVLDFELASLLPLSNTDYLSDFVVTDTRQAGGERNILTASVPEKEIDAYHSVLTDYGIKPELITLGGYARIAWILENIRTVSDTVIVDPGRFETTLAFVRNRKTVMLRVLPAGTPKGHMAAEIRKTALGFKQRTGIDFACDKCIVAADSETGNAAGAAPEAGDGFEVTYRAVEDTYLGSLFRKRRHLLNFCRGKYRAASFFNRYVVNIAAASVIAVAVFALSVMSMHADITYLEKEVAGYEAAQTDLYRVVFPGKGGIRNPYLQLKAELKHASENLASEKSALSPLREKGLRAVDILYEVSDVIPAQTDIEISRFIFNSNRLILSGTADNYNHIDRVKAALEGAGIFTKVSISKAAADKKGGRVNFKFSIEI